MLKAARYFRPDRIVVLGDFADMYCVSAHDRSPNRRHNLEYEVADTNKGLDDLDALGARKKYFVAGNHEDRLERYLMTKAPELFNMVTIPDLLRLKKRGWHYTPYKQSLQIGHMNFTHDVGNAGPYAHIKAQAVFEGNVVIGHTHRAATVYAGNAKGESHVGASFGWLGDVDDVDYMHRVQAMRNWQLGFGVGYLEASGVMHLQTCPIIGRSVVVAGKLITA